MNKYFIISVVIIILLCIFYIIYRNNEYNKLLESFDSGYSYSMPLTQSSLSTYYQNTVDSDYYNVSTNSYNKIIPQNTSSQLNWNAIWKSGNLYAQFLQNNDKIIIAITKSEYPIVQSDITEEDCYRGSFVGIGQLNQSRTSFILKSIICSNLPNENLNLTVGNLSGNISIDSTNKRQIILYSPSKSNTTFTWYKDFSYNNGVSSNNSFMNNLISNVTQSPFITEEDKYVMDNTYPCPPSKKKCNYTYKTNSPPSILGYTEEYSCADNVDNSTKDCLSTPFCYISQNPIAIALYSSSGGPIYPCSNIVSDYMNFMPMKGLVNMSKTSNNTLNVCDYLSRFISCNAFIIGYVDQLGIFRSLNYDFFGPLPDQSNLTLQTDMINAKLNSENGIINYYRKNYITTINDYKYANTTSLKFTNCLESNSNYTNDPQSMISSSSTCYNTLTNYKNKYVPIKDNLNLYPLIWQINADKKSNILNTCGVYISSFPDYPVSQKFIEYSDQQIYLSPNNGGLNQQLLFDNVNIIRDLPPSGSQSFILTANIKTLNNLYLLPSVDQGFSVNTNSVKLAPMPDPNGKWLVIGFNLSNINLLSSTLSSLNYSAT
jgi:hypothetical protein